MSLPILNILSLWDDFQRSFYTEPLMVILNVVFVVLCIKLKPRDKIFNILKLYGIAALIQDIISMSTSLSDYISLDLYRETRIVSDISILVFIQIELYAFFRFFYYQFESKLIQQKFSRFTHVLIAISLISTLNIIFKSQSDIRDFIGYYSVAASIFLLTPSFYYFYILFTDPPVKNLLTESSFWITTGIAFLHGLNIPLFLISDYLKDSHSAVWFDVYTINFVAYCFLFILFIIAILCKNSLKRNFPHQTTPLTS